MIDDLLLIKTLDSSTNILERKKKEDAVLEKIRVVQQAPSTLTSRMLRQHLLTFFSDQFLIFRLNSNNNHQIIWVTFSIQRAGLT